jgi:hypothetical protein
MESMIVPIRLISATTLDFRTRSPRDAIRMIVAMDRHTDRSESNPPNITPART